MYVWVDSEPKRCHSSFREGWVYEWLLHVWRHHGEQEPSNINTEFDVNTDASSCGARAECENFGQMEDMVDDTFGQMEDMVDDTFRVNLSYEGGGEEEIIPNEKALQFYSMMEEVNESCLQCRLTRSYPCV
ncbi:hypothetical protein A2U01_0009734 [Trifolium medium]|uniref:Uncharacterized protein n=1 Tax=Trifolium medium TaxID=97028 RepID=A0A392MNA4_9FABA|nr:hypothetical protein [Trifolium medium]